jgi:post-segregation antitoxin (ccd killing protein)
VPVQKVSVSLDEDVLAEARARVGGRGLSGLVNDALRSHLQQQRLQEWLLEQDTTHGPVPGELLDEARAEWNRGG